MGHNKNVKYVSFEKAIHLNDKKYVYDGMHLTPKGNEIIADGLVEPVRELLPVSSGSQAN